jgi:hypothetical protein
MLFGWEVYTLKVYMFTSCIIIHCDRHSVLIKDQMFHERTKYIDMRYHFI